MRANDLDVCSRDAGHIDLVGAASEEFREAAGERNFAGILSTLHPERSLLPVSHHEVLSAVISAIAASAALEATAKTAELEMRGTSDLHAVRPFPRRKRLHGAAIHATGC